VALGAAGPGHLLGLGGWSDFWSLGLTLPPYHYYVRGLALYLHRFFRLDGSVMGALVLIQF